MIAAKIGQRYLIIKLKLFLLGKVPPPSYYFVLNLLPVRLTLEIRRQVASAAIGIITELVRKSKKSRNCIPMIFTHAKRSISKGRKASKNNHDRTNITSVDFCLHHFNSSWKVDTALSVRAMELVSAAQSTNTKNRIPIGVPKSHTCKYFRNGDEHQRRSCLQSIWISTGKCKYCRNDHQTCHNCNCSIKDLYICWLNLQ